ncbi:hypothetical protein AB0L53_54755 [Nonomuraea sp. NPDC052129]|uniref:phage distal tail protein n=1 Tax=Nonomuraea sp. NPDC052129 TaxID=3154651 RepID=UPI0034133919
MARYGRAYPAPQRRVGPNYRGVQQQFELPVFESVSEWPPVTVTTPNVNITLGAFESVSEWPALTLRYEQRFTLPPFESVSEWPTLTVSIPVKPGDSLTGAHGQVEWNGVLWGPTTDVNVLLPVDGWLGTPSVDNRNVSRPNRGGAWDARKLPQQRIVSIRLQADSATDPTQVHEVLDQVIAATRISSGDEPLPLVVKGYGPPRLAYGQVIDRPILMDGKYNAGLPDIGVLIACGDPNIYSLERRGATIPVGTPTALSNAGNTETSPIIRMEGPVTNPVLVNQTLDRTLRFSITVPSGQILEIDVKNGTVTLAGVNKMSTLTGAGIVPVQDMVLDAGPNTIAYTATSGGDNGADFLWRDAWL